MSETTKDSQKAGAKAEPESTAKDEKPADDGTPKDDTDQEASANGTTEAEAEDNGAPGWGGGADAEQALEIEELQSENAELKDRILRTMAEMENLRRRTEREKADTAKYAVSNFARDMLSIGDNIRRAIEHVPEDSAESDPALKSLLEGVEMTERELVNALERHGITRLDPKGERFDPNFHQAMFEIENADVDAGTVLEVMQQGYIIADRVLRPAMVGVAKGGAKPAKGDDAEATAETPDAANDDAPEAAADPAPEADDEPSTDAPNGEQDDTAADEDSAKKDAAEKPSAGKTVGSKVDKSA